MNQKHFAGLLRLLSEVTNKEISPNLIKLWWRKFGAVDEATFVAAIDRAIDTCTFFPSPVEFTAILENCMTPEERGIQDGIRLLRSWLSRGVLPLGWSDAEFRAVKLALGLPAPTARDLARLAERRGALGDDDDSLEPGPVVARLVGQGELSLASGQ